MTVHMVEFPAECDVTAYRSENPELAKFTPQLLEQHYRIYGVPEGRSGNALKTRADFLALIPSTANVLEIGPYFSPSMTGDNVKYFDVLSREQLIERAISQGQTNPNPPHIDYVSPMADLGIIDAKFDYVVSSYCIEHQTDLIKHLQDVERLLNPGGSYFVMAPDKRYCHDHWMKESGVAEVLGAHHERRTTHPFRSVVEHLALSAHNDHFRHWDGDHGEPYEDFLPRLHQATHVFENANGNYVDVHSWYFTPDSMREIIGILNRTGDVKLSCVRCYDTRKYHNDFWVILQKSH